MDKIVEAKFNIGDVVTIKSHPLSYQENGLIDMYITHIPPFMVVKEIHIEPKKLIFSEHFPESQIADKVKYVCVYFNQRDMMFEEKYLYESILLPLNKKDIIFHSNMHGESNNNESLIEETSNYEVVNYEYGKRLFFKTYKLEKRKKLNNYQSKNDFDTKPKKKKPSYKTHTSPAFILNGIKENENKSTYDSKNGSIQKKYSKVLYKVIWYNSYQEKYSEEYMPQEFFVADDAIYTKINEKQIEQNLIKV